MALDFHEMWRAKEEFVAGWRTLWDLGRVSYLPTIWSNCLAGWLLNDGDGPVGFFALCVGASCFYLGGAFLNDACDAPFDALNDRQRPIPAGRIERQTVSLLSLGWFALGTLFLAWLGNSSALLALLLLACIILYNLVHRAIIFSPGLPALCRFQLYLLAGAATGHGISGLTIWSGLALAAYVIGVSYLARKESTPLFFPHWPCYLLAAPLVLAWLVNDRGYRLVALLFITALGAWILSCLRYTFWSAHRNLSLTVSGLMTGIVLVDLLAVAGGSVFGWVFLLWFIAVLLFERILPTG